MIYYPFDFFLLKEIFIYLTPQLSYYAFLSPLLFCILNKLFSDQISEFVTLLFVLMQINYEKLVFFVYVNYSFSLFRLLHNTYCGQTLPIYIFLLLMNFHFIIYHLKEYISLLILFILRRVNLRSLAPVVFFSALPASESVLSCR